MVLLGFIQFEPIVLVFPARNATSPTLGCIMMKVGMVQSPDPAGSLPERPQKAANRKKKADHLENFVRSKLVNPILTKIYFYMQQNIQHNFYNVLKVQLYLYYVCNCGTLY